MDAGAEDVKADGNTIEVISPLHDFDKVKKALENAKIPYSSAKITMVPQNSVPMDESKAKQMLDLMDDLDNHDDVQNVFANFDIPESVMEKVAV